MSKSVFSQNLYQGLKQKRIDSLPLEEKTKFRLKTIEQLFLELSNKENRFIFYCPDIVVVNHLVKSIYDIAYALHSLKFNVTILHEIKGFKCKWLIDNDDYSHYRQLKIDYVIDKKSSKSKKEKNNYQFKPTDTIIIPDAFQDILENLKEVTLLQKVVLVSSYVGISNLNLETGGHYNSLGVKNLLFIDEVIKKDYEETFPNMDNYFLISNSKTVNKTTFNTGSVTPKEVYPVIALSDLGNKKLSQTVINLFYNKYPNLRVFSFKFLDRNNYEEYVNSLKHSALYLNLDENLGTSQNLFEALNLGTPTVTFERREFEEDKFLMENIIISKKDAFSIVEYLKQFCSYWLTTSNKTIKEDVLQLMEKSSIKEFDFDKFQLEIKTIFEVLHQERIKYFSLIKKSIEQNEINELSYK